MRVCVIVFGVWTIYVLRLRFRSLSLSCPSAPALRCLRFITGAGELPRCFDFSFVCAAQVPVAPAVGALLPCMWLVPRWHRVRGDACVVCSFRLMGPIGIVLSARHKYSTPACTSTFRSCAGYMHVQRPDWGIAVCGSCSVGGLAFIVLVCLWWFPALVPACLFIPNHCVSL